MTRENEKTKPAQHNFLSENAICDSDPILGVLLRRSDATRKGAFAFLVALPVALFIYFMLITIREDRFWLHSMVSETGYLGMSFLGDSMVWPFFFFIPLLLYLLRRAICESVALLSDKNNIIIDGPESQQKYSLVLVKAENHLLYKGVWKLAYGAAIAVGLTFWLYNTITCYNPAIFGEEFPTYATDSPVYIPPEVTVEFDEFPGRDRVFESLIKPYATQQKFSDKLTINAQQYQLTWTGAIRWRDYQALLSFSPQPQWQTGVTRLYQQKRGYKVWLDKSVSVPKWDTELDAAPVSWVSARVWILVLGYTLLPLVLLRVYNLLFVIRFFYKQLSDKLLLVVEPISVDERRNLQAVSKVVLKINYTIAVLLVLLFLSFMKEGLEADLHNYFVFIPSVPMFLFLFLWPLISIRDVVRRYKSAELERHARILDDIYKEVDEIAANADASSEENKRLGILKESMALREKLYKKVNALTVWPISKNTVMKYAASILLPVVIAVVNKLFAGLFSFIFG